MDQDIPEYVRLAFKRGVELHNVEDSYYISLHKVVQQGAVECLKALGELFSAVELHRIAEMTDDLGTTAFNYAKASNIPDMRELFLGVVSEKAAQEQLENEITEE